MRWNYLALLGGLLSLVSVSAGADLQDLGDGIALLRGEFVAGAQPDGNSVVMDTGEGLLIFDTGRHPSHTGQLLAYAKARKKNVSRVVNSHWHLDHVGGNLLLRQQFPALRVMASAAFSEARSGFLAAYKTDLEGAISQAVEPQLSAYLGELHLLKAIDQLAPDEVLTDARTEHLGALDVQWHVQKRAATSADIWAYLPAQKLLLAGDLVTLPVPFFDTACNEGWSKALADLEAQPFERLLPGHGPVLNRAQFKQWRHAFERLRQCAAQATTATVTTCREQWLTDAGELVPAEEYALTRQSLDYYLDSALKTGSVQSAACL